MKILWFGSFNNMLKKQTPTVVKLMCAIQGKNIRNVKGALKHLFYVPGQINVSETFWCVALARNTIVSALVGEIHSPYLTRIWSYLN